MPIAHCAAQRVDPASFSLPADCTLWTLTKKDFHREVAPRAPWMRLLHFARRVPFFTGVTDAELLGILTGTSQEHYADGDLIIQRRVGPELQLSRLARHWRGCDGLATTCAVLGAVREGYPPHTVPHGV